MSATLARIETLEAMLGQLGVYLHAADKRMALAEQLVEQRMNTEHLRALLGKFGGDAEAGGKALRCLQGDWRSELDTWAVRELARATRATRAAGKETPEARMDREEAEGVAARARSNGRSVDTQRRRDLRGAIWERIAYGRRLPTELQSEFRMDATRIVEELRALQAEETHRDVDALLASVAEARERKNWPGSSTGRRNLTVLRGDAP